MPTRLICSVLAEICNVLIPTLMGWGAIPDDHPLMAGMAGLQTLTVMAMLIY